MSKKDELQCDFSQVSRRWGVRWAQIENDVPILVQVIYGEGRDDLTSDEQRQVEIGKIEAREKFNALIDERQALMAQVITHVPREWLVKGAPDEIDWSNPDNLLDWVREDKTTQLMLGVSLARNEAAKNSLAHTSSNGKDPQPR